MKTPGKKTRKPRAGKHVVLIGLGNIGSPLSEMLTRTEAVKRLTFIDMGVYETRDMLGQAIQRGDVGRPKANAQADRARQIRPDLHVEAIHAAAEDVPLGRLRADVVMTGLDSKRSRQCVNQRIWRLGVPWVDAGVMAEGRLARVNVYLPGDNQPCLECAWDENDYKTLEVKRPCRAEADVARTGAPVFLGSLAAALQMTECEKILRGDWPSVAVGKQITIAAASHKLYETTLRRNPKCRFDHSTCHIHPLRCHSRSASLGELMSELKRRSGNAEPVRFQVEGRLFERGLRCPCGEEKLVFCLEGRMAASERVCAHCGRTMAAVGFSMLPFVSEEALAPEDKDRPLAGLGLGPGDVIMLKSPAGLKGFELATA